MLHLPWIKSLLQKSLRSFPSAYWPLSVCKISKKSLEWIQSYEDGSFLGPDWSICPKQELFWEKLLILFPSTYWNLSLCKVLKDSYNGSRVMRMCHFGLKMGLFAQKKFFFSGKPCSCHSCLCTSQKLNSKINLLMTYWRLKNTEISLAESHFWP